MSHENLNLDPAEQELSRALGSLRPASVELAFDRLAFEALRRQSTRQLRLWRATAALLAIGLVAVTLVTALSESPTPAPLAEAPAPSPAGSPTVYVMLDSTGQQRSEYLRLRDAVLRDGLQALPTVRSTSSGRVLSVRDGSGV